MISVAAYARLHFKHGWHDYSLGMQPDKGSAFDLGAFRPPDFAQLHIAAEIKPTAAKLAVLTRNLERCCVGDHDAACFKPQTIRRNAHRKWAALSTLKPSILWLVGPSPHSKVYQLCYPPNGSIELHAADNSLLNFSDINL